MTFRGYGSYPNAIRRQLETMLKRPIKVGGRSASPSERQSGETTVLLQDAENISWSAAPPSFKDPHPALISESEPHAAGGLGRAIGRLRDFITRYIAHDPEKRHSDVPNTATEYWIG